MGLEIADEFSAFCSHTRREIFDSSLQQLAGIRVRDLDRGGKEWQCRFWRAHRLPPVADGVEG